MFDRRLRWSLNPTSSSGFTILELLIALGLLTVIAVLVLPQLRAAGHDAQCQAALHDLKSFRRQIEQYRHHHDGRLPAAGTDSATLFADQLQRRTSHTGEVSPAGRYGPYLLGPLPANPWNFSSRILVVNGPLETHHFDGRGNHGWAYSSATGEFKANVSSRLKQADGKGINDIVSP